MTELSKFKIILKETKKFNNVNYLYARRKYKYSGFQLNNISPIANNMNYRPRNNQAGIIYPNDKSIEDITVELKQGSEAPLAYVGKKEFPDWYKPYLANYNGHGYLIISFLFLTFFSYVQYKTVLKAQGRDKIESHRDEHTLFNQFFVRGQQLKEFNKNDQIPMFNYAKRYIKESGF